MRSARRAVATTIAFGAVLTACQLILGIEREPGALLDVVEPAEAGPDVGPGPRACVFARPPAQPAPQPEARLDPMFFAVREFRFRRGAAIRGYDLDGFCTGEATSPNGSPCKRGSANVPDEDGGVDNASAFVKLFADDAPAATLNSQIAKKSFTVMLQLTQYNGLPNDDLVNVAFVSATGRNAAADCAGTALTDAATGECPDTWDYPDAETPLRPGQPSLEGWVRDGILVAKSTGQLRFGLGQSTLALGSPIVTGQLVAKDGTFSLVDGLVTGRVPVGNLLGVIGAFDILGRLCSPDHPIGAPAREAICAARDLMGSPNAEPTETQCDALSFVMGFDAVRALTGATKEIPVTTPCPDAYLRCPE